MGERAHPGVDAYIDGLSPWQRDICTELREIIWEADPDIEETIKRSVQPYFVLDRKCLRPSGDERPHQPVPVRPDSP